jgi:pre-mRNA cleavage complex 2 protein Pcf11
MEGLLKTWKQPVPESMETRPVFPAEVTREIENALIKYKTITIQHQQQQQQQQPRPKQMQGITPRPAQGDPWRNTPTPPQNAPFYSTPSDPRLRQVSRLIQTAAAPLTILQSTPQQQPAQNLQSGSANSTPNHGTNSQEIGAPVDLNKLLTDVANLIESTKVEMISDVGNASIRTKLQVLQALQTRLKSGDVSPAQLKAVQDHVAGLTGTPKSTPKPAPVQSFPPFAPSTAPSLPQFPQISASPHPPQPSPTPPLLPFAIPPIANLATPPVPNAQSTTLSLVELLRQNAASAPPTTVPSAPPPMPPSVPTNLADILRQFSNPQANAVPPVVPVPQPPVKPPPPISNSLLEALRAQNLLPNMSPSAPPFAGSSEPALAILPSAPLDRVIGSAAQMENDVELSTASITKRQVFSESRYLIVLTLRQTQATPDRITLWSHA